MKNVQSRMVLVKGIVGSAYDIEYLNEILTDVAKNEGEEAMKNLHILNVLHEVPRVGVFPLEKVEGSLYIDRMDVRSPDDKYILHDYNDREFSSEDDLNDFVRREIEKGMLTLEEAKSLDITYVEESKCDMDITQEEDEWRLDVQNFEESHRETMDAMGIEYVAAHEAQKKIDQLELAIDISEAAQSQINPEPEVLAPENMSDDEIAFELNKLETRLHILYKEQRQRKA